jgi:hypothetical protein
MSQQQRDALDQRLRDGPLDLGSTAGSSQPEAVAPAYSAYHRLASLAPPALVWTVLSAFYLVLALPLAAGLLRPLWTRVYRPRPGIAG